MPETPFLSIILPTYNSAKTLGDTLESIACQTFSNYEVLLVDGASKDDTLAIASRYTYTVKNLTILSEKDAGIYDAMNKGILHSKGKWLYFLGSDDSLYQKETLIYLFSQFENEFNQNDIVFGHVIYKEWYNFSHYHTHFSKRDILNGNINHQAIFYKRDVFEKVGLYQLTYPVFADWHFNMRCTFHKGIKMKHINAIIAVYSVLGTSNVKEDDFLKEKEALFKELIKKLSVAERLTLPFKNEIPLKDLVLYQTKSFLKKLAFR